MIEFIVIRVVVGTRVVCVAVCRCCVPAVAQAVSGSGVAAVGCGYVTDAAASGECL